jgi:hypothetical protein
MVSLLDVRNGVCFLEHIMVSHRTKVPVQIKGYVSQVVAISLPIHLVVHMFEQIVNCETGGNRASCPMNTSYLVALVTKHMTYRQSSLFAPLLKLSAIKSKLSPSTSSTLPLVV